MQKSTHNKAFHQVLTVKQELSELEKLRLENQWLKSDNQKLKAILLNMNIEF